MDANELSYTNRARVLLVDDEPLNLSALGRLLRRHYEVLAATSGARALEIASSDSKPDLILLDIQMPDMNGFQVLKRLKEDPLTRDIPVIFITVMDAMDDFAEGLQAGAVDYIAKPFSNDIVLARIATHLVLKKVTDELVAARALLATRAHAEAAI